MNGNLKPACVRLYDELDSFLHRGEKDHDRGEPESSALEQYLSMLTPTGKSVVGEWKKRAIALALTRPELVKVGENVRQLCKRNNVRFLHISPSNDPANPFFVNKQIDEGVMVFESNDEPSSITGREHSKRKMPV